MSNSSLHESILPLLPPINLKLSDRTYWQLSKASRALATLNTYIIHSTENIGLLVLWSFLIKEWVASSAIENIHTTLESVLQAEVSSGNISKEDKEVLYYKQATLWWMKQVEENNALITNTLITIQSFIEPTKPWIRKIPWTVLMNSKGEVVYTPPVWEQIIKNLLSNLEEYINNDQDEIDPLIKLAVIHYQFESIHPFYDGNGRTGRIVMVLYLVLKELLQMPILYLSEYINTHKKTYYEVLQNTREKNDRDWLIQYILTAVEKQAIKTKNKLEAISHLIREKKQEIDRLWLKIPWTFIDYFFDRPYCSIAMIEKETVYSKNTIIKYTRLLEQHSIIVRITNQKEKSFYIAPYVALLYGESKK